MKMDEKKLYARIIDIADARRHDLESGKIISILILGLQYRIDALNPENEADAKTLKQAMSHHRTKGASWAMLTLFKTATGEHKVQCLGQYLQFGSFFMLIDQDNVTQN